MTARPRYPSDHEPTRDVRPATGRFEDVATVVGTQKKGAGGCWCMAYRDSRVPTAERPEFMERACTAEPGPGVLAYVDDEVAGWCSIAPREDYRRLLNSRTIPLLDESDVWIAVCFVVRAGFRGHGLMHTLLDGAVAHAAGHGARVIEGYPVATEAADRVDVISGYVGTVRLFQRAGFRKAGETSGRSGGRPRWVMRKRVS